ncbi:MAG: hypothetical protein AAGA58_17930, partial [Verrucomicrobiota bacterium]
SFEGLFLKILAVLPLLRPSLHSLSSLPNPFSKSPRSFSQGISDDLLARLTPNAVLIHRKNP